MAHDLEDDDFIQLGVSANLARRYAADQREFVEYLATMLENVLPGEVEVARRGALFAHKTVSAIRLRLGEHAYSLEVPPHGPLIAQRTRIVRGIRLKTEPIPVEEWLAMVGEQVAEYARVNKEASAALSRILGE
jgi:hypothetical protein